MKNTVVRTISGIGFLAVMIGALMWCKFSFAVLMMVIMGMMMFEFFRMTMGKSYKFSQILAILAAEILFMLTFLSKSYDIPGKMVMLAIIPVFIVMVNSLYVRDKTEFGKFANLYTAMLYIAVPLSLTNFAVFDRIDGSYSGLLIVCFFAIVWGSDVGAYVFGITLGRRFGKKLFPEISPKKSWVGFWGGFASAIAVAVGLHYAGWLDLPVLHCVILAVVMDVAGVYGDLIESQWKRHYTIKDSGVAIPGHGGFLDRFDSALMAIPVGIIVMELLNVL
ncbi:MAG: phosphatidate cytidylyltransferase [Bacteroidales bacterium]|nr:phosphatidate cytidylyltransferase [Bacteroides sp.]MCM1199573.1 phosphatidate cytidylyltransferase [Clostridium sp.]MCM1502102.1 phosphatidate cytidylyltransferase [Bacteroidales bacterium]